MDGTAGQAGEWRMAGAATSAVSALSDLADAAGKAVEPAWQDAAPASVGPGWPMRQVDMRRPPTQALPITALDAYSKRPGRTGKTFAPERPEPLVDSPTNLLTEEPVQKAVLGPDDVQRAPYGIAELSATEEYDWGPGHRAALADASAADRPRATFDMSHQRATVDGGNAVQAVLRETANSGAGAARAARAAKPVKPSGAGRPGWSGRATAKVDTGRGEVQVRSGRPATRHTKPRPKASRGSAAAREQQERLQAAREAEDAAIREAMNSQRQLDSARREVVQDRLARQAAEVRAKQAEKQLAEIAAAEEQAAVAATRAQRELARERDARSAAEARTQVLKQQLAQAAKASDRRQAEAASRELRQQQKELRQKQKELRQRQKAAKQAVRGKGDGARARKRAEEQEARMVARLQSARAPAAPAPQAAVAAAQSIAQPMTDAAAALAGYDPARALERAQQQATREIERIRAARQQDGDGDDAPVPGSPPGLATDSAVKRRTTAWESDVTEQEQDALGASEELAPASAMPPAEQMLKAFNGARERAEQQRLREIERIQSARPAAEAEQAGRPAATERRTGAERPKSTARRRAQSAPRAQTRRAAPMRDWSAVEPKVSTTRDVEEDPPVARPATARSRAEEQEARSIERLSVPSPTVVACQPEPRLNRRCLGRRSSAIRRQTDYEANPPPAEKPAKKKKKSVRVPRKRWSKPKPIQSKPARDWSQVQPKVPTCVPLPPPLTNTLDRDDSSLTPCLLSQCARAAGIGAEQRAAQDPCRRRGHQGAGKPAGRGAGGSHGGAPPLEAAPENSGRSFCCSSGSPGAPALSRDAGQAA